MAVMGTGTAKPPFVHRDSVGRSIAGGDTGSRRALSSVSMTICRSHRYKIAVICPKQEEQHAFEAELLDLSFMALAMLSL